MAKRSKRMQAIRAKLTPGKFYPVEEALGLLKELSGVKFRESVAQGLAAAPEAFIGLLKGRNFGKQLVKLS